MFRIFWHLEPYVIDNLVFYCPELQMKSLLLDRQPSKIAAFY
jgi:hypothetical protein